MGGAGGAADALVHQGAAEVVAAGVEAGHHALVPHLHPAGLNVGDVRVQGQAGHGVHEDGLAEGRPLAGLALEVHGRLHVDEGQRHELGEAAGLRLQAPHPQQVPRPMLRPLHMAVHDGGGGPEAGAVGGLHDLQPLFGVDLVRADLGAHLVVQYLRGGAGQGAEAGGLQKV